MKIRELITELRVSQPEEGNRFFMYNDKVWLIDENNDDRAKEITKNLGITQKIEYIDDLIEYVLGNRPDVVTGKIVSNELHLNQYNDPHNQWPTRSLQIKKLMKHWKIQTVKIMVFSSQEEEQIEDTITDINQQIFYHGTSWKWLGDILKKGIMPTDWSNFSNIKTPGLIFLTASKIEAEGHALRNISKWDEDSVNSTPIIVGVRIPNMNLIQPDYDVMSMLNHHYPDEIKKSVYNKNQYGDRHFSNLGKLKRPVKFLNNFPEFGYKGRIPANFIVEFYSTLDGTGDSSWKTLSISEMKDLYLASNKLGYVSPDWEGMTYSQIIDLYQGLEDDE